MPRQDTPTFTCLNVTATGGSHRADGLACEDSSGSMACGNGEAQIIVVADGHGDKTCTRSSFGSKLAVKAALSTVSQAYTVLGSNPSEAQLDALSNRLPEIIVQTWMDAVERHATLYPPTPDEHLMLSSGKSHRSLAHLYGSTLVAALIAPWGCILLQQGDGCCSVLDSKGRYHMPLPDDERCVGNKTSSLSDSDASARMRLALVDAEPHEIAACLVMTDGISKSLPNNDALFDFLDWVLLSTDGMEASAYKKWLQTEFDRFGSDGVGDDLSLAAAFQRPVAPELLKLAESRRKRHALEQEVSEAKARLISLERKHQKLELLWLNGKQDEARDYPAVHTKYLDLQKLIESHERQLAGLE